MHLEQRQEECPPDLIFVTGDIAQRGQPKEYERAREFFEQLVAITGVAPEDGWFFVPGNHDIDRSKITDLEWNLLQDPTQQDLEDFFINPSKVPYRDIISQRLRAYYDFTASFLGEQRAWQAARPWMAEKVRIKEMDIGVMQLNSAWYSGRNDEEAKLLLGEVQVDTSLDVIRESALKIGLIHHPLTDLCQADQDVIENLLASERGVDFLLRGHRHRHDPSKRSTPDGGYMELAAGTLYVDGPHPLGYMSSTLNFATGEGVVEMFTYSDRSGGFWVEDNQAFKEAPDGKWTFQLPPHLRRREPISQSPKPESPDEDEPSDPEWKNRLDVYKRSVTPLAARFQVAGEHFSRAETDNTIALIKQGLSVLCVGEAGSGKSGVLTDVISALEAEPEVSVLSLHADRLNPNRERHELLSEYGLHESPTQLLGQLMQLESSSYGVLIIDQLDELSELMPSPEKIDFYHTIETLLLEALRSPNYAFIAACRSFDLEHDSRFKQLSAHKDVHKLEVEPLSSDIIRETVTRIGYQDTLSTTQLQIFARPLHLRLLSETFRDESRELPLNEIDLYDRYWQQVQRRFEKRFGSGEWARLARTLYGVMEEQEDEHIPVFALESRQAQVDWLLSEGILTYTGRSTISFFHGSLTEYISARCFEGDLVEHLLNGIQPLRERRRVRIILTLMRQRAVSASTKRAYISTLEKLFGSEIRPHLQHVAATFLTQVIQPINEELSVVLALLESYESFPREQGVRILSANPAFSNMLDEQGYIAQWRSVPPALLSHSESAFLVERQIENLLKIDTTRGVYHIKSMLSDELKWPILHEVFWRSALTFKEKQIFDVLLDAVDAGLWGKKPGNYDFTHQIPRQHFVRAIEFSGRIMRRRWKLISSSPPLNGDREDLYAFKERLFNVPFRLDELLNGTLTSNEHEAMLEYFLPLFVDITAFFAQRGRATPSWWMFITFSYPDNSDCFFLLCLQTAYAMPSRALITLEPLTKLDNPFARYIWWSTASKSGLKDVEVALEDMLKVMQRGGRLRVYDSLVPAVELLKRAFVLFPNTLWPDLETALASHYPKELDVKYSDIEQYAIIEALPDEMQTPQLRQRLGEAQRRHPRYEPDIERAQSTGGMVSSIDTTGPDENSPLDQWMSYILHANPSSNDFLYEPSKASTLRHYTQLEPQHFVELTLTYFDTNTPAWAYNAVLDGLYNVFSTSAPRIIVDGEEIVATPPDAQRIHTVAHHALMHRADECAKSVASLLKKIGAHVPALSLVEKLSGCLDEPNEDEVTWEWQPSSERDLYMAAINITRGSIASTLANWVRMSAEVFEAQRERIARVTGVPDTRVRAAMSEVVLMSLIHERSFALRLFAELVRAQPDELLAVPHVTRFFSYLSYEERISLWPIIERMLASSVEEVAKMGGIILTWLSFEDPTQLPALSSFAHGDDDSLHVARGIADAIVHNVAQLSPQHWHLLIDLSNLGDEPIAHIAAKIFHEREQAHRILSEQEDFVRAFIDSPSFSLNPRWLIDALETSSSRLTETALMVCEELIKSTEKGERTGFMGSEKITTLLMRIYQDNPGNEPLRIRVLNLLDRLVVQGVWRTTSMLDDLDVA